MYPGIHFILSLIASLALIPFIKYYSILFFIGSFLVDIDHNLWYLFKHKSLSLKKAIQYHVQRTEFDLLHIFHTIEFLILFLGIDISSVAHPLSAP